MKVNLKRQLWLGFSIILASVVVAYGGLYFLAGSLASVTQKIVSDRSLIDEQTGALAAAASLKDQAAQAVSYQIAMDNLLPTQDDLIDFSPWIAKIAGADDVSASLQFQGNLGSAASGDAFGSTPFTLVANGALNNIVMFLSDIEEKQQGFLVEINSVELTYQNGTYQFNGQGQVFFKT